MLVYLDSSAIVKRYLEEIGTDSVDLLYNRLEKEDPSEENPGLVFSAWNLGEAYGAIDSRYRRGELDRGAVSRALGLLSRETRKFVVMKKIAIAPIGSGVLTASRELVLKYHIYQADALQLASARKVGAGLFVSADRNLLECARSEKMNAVNPERDYASIETAISRPNKEGADEGKVEAREKSN